MLICLVSCFGQESALSVARCRTDQRAWLAVLNPPDPVYDDDPRLPPWDDQSRQNREMQRCRLLDTALAKGYDSVTAEIVADRTIRIGRFLRRHDLLDQFNTENPDLKPVSPRQDRLARMQAFLTQHGLFQQFKREDAFTHRTARVVSGKK